jgi:hypothetical protein
VFPPSRVLQLRVCPTLNPNNGTLFIPKNDLITPCGMNKKNSLHDHTIVVWFTPSKLHDHTMFVWPSKIYSHPKMDLFIPTRFDFTPYKFCSRTNLLVSQKKNWYRKKLVSQKKYWYRKFECYGFVKFQQYVCDIEFSSYRCSHERRGRVRMFWTLPSHVRQRVAISARCTLNTH